MPKFSRAGKTLLALLAGGLTIIGIGAGHQARLARSSDGSSSGSQNRGGRSSNTSNISGSRQEYAEICYDPATGQRLDNVECDSTLNSSTSNGSSHARTYYIPYSSSSTLPKVGQTVTGGSETRPANGTVFRHLPAQGGSFAESFRESKGSYTVKNSQVTSTQRGNSKGGFDQVNSKRSGRGGFGGGSKTGGGTKGG